MAASARTTDPGPDCRLASYGTLRPGKSNHHWLFGVDGSWTPGFVRGTVTEQDGDPVRVLDPDGDHIAVEVFESEDLPKHWARLDVLEGPNYRRTMTEVQHEDGSATAAMIYVAR